MGHRGEFPIPRTWSMVNEFCQGIGVYEEGPLYVKGNQDTKGWLFSPEDKKEFDYVFNTIWDKFRVERELDYDDEGW